MTKRFAMLMATTALASMTSTAFAQSAPEQFRNDDANGVDLTTGTYNPTFVEAEVGPADGGLRLLRHWGRTGWQDNWSGNLRRAMESGVETITITFGDISEKFTLSGGNWVNAKANGGTLTAGSGSYAYRTAGGTTISYDSVFTGTPDLLPSYAAAGCTEGEAIDCALPAAITEANGNNYTLAWNRVERCTYDAELNANCTIFARLQDVRSRSSYGMKIKYGTNSFPINNMAPPTGWASRTGVRFFDLSQVYCDPQAFNCDSVTAAASVAYASPSAGVTNVTDENGGTTRYDVSSGTAFRIRRPGSATDNTVVTIGTGGRVTNVTDDGESTNYNWTVGATTTVTATTGAGESVTATSTGTAGQPTTVTNGTTNSTTITYDANGRKTRETLPEGDYTNWTYDPRGNITETRHVSKTPGTPADIVTTADYDVSCANPAKCNKPNFTIDAKGNRTDYTYDLTHGGVTRVQLPAATTGGTRPQVDYVYTALTPQVRDASNNLVNASAPEYKVTQITTCATAATCAGTANETKVTIAYATPNLLPTSVTTASGNGAVTSTVAYGYDAADNLITVDGPLAGTADTTTYFYDANNRRRGAIGPDPDGAGSRTRLAERYSFDADSRVIKVEIGSATAATDAALTAMTVAQTLDTVFDTRGNVSTETLKSGSTSYALTQYGYDVDNRLTCTAVRMNPAVYASLPTDACVASTLDATNGPDRIVKNSYDANGRVTKVQTAYGQTEQADEVTAVYSANGRIASVKDGEANLTSYDYDGHDRLLKTRYPVGTQGANASSTTDYEQLSYDANSNVIQRRLRDGQLIGFTYDNLDRVTLKDLPSPESDASFSYDLLGRMLTATQNSQTLTNIYDALSRLTSAVGPLGTASYGYDVAGRRTSLGYPAGGTALTINYDYDVTGNVTAIRENGAVSGVGVLATYAFDNLGRRTTLTRGNGGVTSWSYDAVSRLSGLSHDLYATAHDVSTSFAYNPASQIASSTRNNDVFAWTGHANGSKADTHNGLNQLTANGATSITHDARGNITGIGAANYTYSAENLLLTGPNGATLSYDPAMRLYQASGATENVRFAYDGVDRIAEYDTTGTLLRRFVHGLGSDEPLVHYEGATLSNRGWSVADERGSLTAWFGNTVIWLSTNYDEYGNPQGTVNRFGYTGQTWLPDLGLWHYKSRAYNPALGRFMQTDTIGYSDGMNWYAYVGGDPTNFVDPTGEDSFDIDDVGPGRFRDSRYRDPWVECAPSDWACRAGFEGGEDEEIVVTARERNGRGGGGDVGSRFSAQNADIMRDLLRSAGRDYDAMLLHALRLDAAGVRIHGRGPRPGTLLVSRGRGKGRGWIKPIVRLSQFRDMTPSERAAYNHENNCKIANGAKVIGGVGGGVSLLARLGGQAARWIPLVGEVSTAVGAGGVVASEALGCK